MRVLLDVNVSSTVASWFQQQGHDVELVSVADPRMPDDAILAWAVRDQRVIVTTDRDFEGMVWRQGRIHSGLLRLENLPRHRRLTLLERTLAHYSRDLEAGAIVIAEERKTRIRRK
jgi:predicted nuclease of predicted toxin-antitoxin system